MRYVKSNNFREGPVGGNPRDHGGGLDAAAAFHGGPRAAWLDLSTGINPLPYRCPEMSEQVWTILPDKSATDALERAARAFWGVPDHAALVAGPGASALIARLPELVPPGHAAIAGPTYNEHAAAFVRAGWSVGEPGGDARVAVHPNNPDGRLWTADEITAGTPGLMLIDESFADLVPERSLIALAARPGVVVLKSFGKFWGLAGLRLGFAIGDPALIEALRAALGPWPVSGPALAIGRAALTDPGWAAAARRRLAADAARLDRTMTGAGAAVVGGTALFRLYEVDDAAAWQTRLALGRVWSRVFPYSDRWLRLGLPGGPAAWRQLEAAL